MARIRSVKPTFWTDEKIVELSPWARLYFIGLWNFVDDDGRMEYSPKRLKMQIFPADSVEVAELSGELGGKDLIEVYEVDGKQYLQVKNFAKHQKVDKRTPSKLPACCKCPAELPLFPPTEGKGGEGKGREGNGEDYSEKPSAVSPCPHQEIIDLYHEILPMGRQVRKGLWNGTRAKHLAARWKEDRERRSLLWWGKFFHHCAKSAFLTGRKPPRRPGDKPFEISLDWIVEPGNFVKIIEGAYDD